jgi:hypothetical protein
MNIHAPLQLANCYECLFLAAPLQLEVVQRFMPRGLRCKAALLDKPAVAPGTRRLSHGE